LAVLAKISFKKDDLVIINLSGRGDKDMETYQRYFDQPERTKSDSLILIQNLLFIP